MWIKNKDWCGKLEMNKAVVSRAWELFLYPVALGGQSETKKLPEVLIKKTAFPPVERGKNVSASFP